MQSLLSAKLKEIKMKEELNVYYVLHFLINKLHFCIELTYVDKLLLLPALKELPSSANYVVGLLNLASENIPIIDLGMCLQLQRLQPYPLNTSILICFKENRPISEVASGKEVEGDTDQKAGVNTQVQEDSSTLSTNQLSSYVAFQNRSNLKMGLIIDDVVGVHQIYPEINKNLQFNQEDPYLRAVNQKENSLMLLNVNWILKTPLMKEKERCG